MKISQLKTVAKTRKKSIEYIYQFIRNRKYAAQWWCRNHEPFIKPSLCPNEDALRDKIGSIGES